jgi:hypothetical protein
MQRSRIILFVLAVMLVLLAFPAIAGADETPDSTSGGGVTATEPAPDGWTWDEVAPDGWTWDEVAPDGWTWDEASVPESVSDEEASSSPESP